MPATYQITRDDLFTVALQHCQVLGQGETIGANDITDVTRHAQLLLKYFNTKGWNTWLTKTISFTAITARSSGYAIGTAAGADVAQDRPVQIAQAYTRDANGYDTPLTPLTRQEWELLTPKTSVGPPNSFYYDRGVTPAGNGLFYPWPILADTSLTFYCVEQRPILDLVASSTATFDVEQEVQMCLGWCLAEQIMGMCETEESQCRRIEKNAAKYLAECFDFTEEQGSIYLQPNPQGGYGRR